MDIPQISEKQDENMATALAIALLLAVAGSLLYFGETDGAKWTGYVFVYLAVIFTVGACAGINQLSSDEEV